MEKKKACPLSFKIYFPLLETIDCTRDQSRRLLKNLKHIQQKLTFKAKTVFLPLHLVLLKIPVFDPVCNLLEILSKN